MKTAVVFGSFDLLHKGHRYFLQEARKHCEHLVVVLARDEEIVHLKRRKPAQNFAKRQAALLESGLVHEVLRSDVRHGSFTVLKPLLGKRISVILGNDQEALRASFEQFLRREHTVDTVHIIRVQARHRKVFSSTRLHQLRGLGAYAILFLAMLFWGSSWIIGKVMAVSGLPAPLATTLRMSVLAFFFLLWNLLHSWQNCARGKKREVGKEAFFLDKDNLLLLLFSGLCFTAYNLCFFYGLQTVFANQGGILTSVLVPFFATLLYHLRYKLALKRTQIWGLLIGLLAGFTLLGAYAQVFWQSQASLFIGTGLSWSIITLLSAKIQQRYSLQKYSFYVYFFAAIMSSWGWFWYQPGIIEWFSLLLLVFLGSIIGTSLYFQSLRLLKPSHVANCLFLNPVPILLMSWLLLKEPWTMELSIGTFLAITAIILLNRRRS